MGTDIQFTKRILDELPRATPGKRVYYRDTRAPASLRLSVTDTGAKSWVIQRRVQGRVTRITLGRYPDLTPENARKKAEQIAGQIASGQNPQEELRRSRGKHVTLRDALEQMLQTRPLKPKTQAVYRQVLKGALGDWMDRPLVLISKDAVAERHAKLTHDSGGAYANSAMRTLRSIWNFTAGLYEDADGASMLPPNPVDRLSKTKAWNRVKRRETYIKEHELPAWFAAVSTLRNEPWNACAQTVGDYVTLMLCTGLRRSEAINLTWEQIDLRARTLTLTDTKNRDSHTLPLSDYVTELLQDRKKHVDSPIFVFPGDNPVYPLQEPRRHLRWIAEESGVEFTLHDLRRTFSTVAENLDLSHYALKRLLNHRMTGDVTAGYIGKNVERLRAPMQKITDYLLSAGGIRPVRVIPIHHGKLEESAA